MKVSISFSIFLDLSISKEDAAMSMENMRLPYILLVVIQQKGIYYYTTYDNHQISAVDMTKEDLNTKNLICYEVITGEHIQMQN